MNRIYYITMIILFLALRTAAQDRDGDVTVHSDPRLSVLIKKKKVVMQASVAKPPAHHTAETRVAGAAHIVPGTAVPVVVQPASHQLAVNAHTPAVGPPRFAPDAPPPAANDTKHTKEVAAHVTPAKAPVYILEKEGRVVYSGKGFRVQIYSGPDREKAINVKKEFMRHFPGTRTYLNYKSPSFRVKVGNYRSRAEAAGMLREANGIYSPCVIVPDMITINTR